jgi:hypothetical protein
MGNAVGGIRDVAYGAGAGGVNDTTTRGGDTGGVTGFGLGANVPVGGVNGGSINTGGIQGSAIGAGTGGLTDLNSLGAQTGGTKEGDNAPRFRVIQ